MSDKPLVSIVVTAYLEKSKPYLDLCIESIKNLDYPKDKLETIVVSSLWYDPKYDGVITVHPEKHDYFNSHALNYGAAHSNLEAKYIFFLNDDVVLTRNSLANLVSTSQGLSDRALLMPIGNDAQGKMALYIEGGHGPYKYDQLGDTKAMMNLNSIYPPGVFFFETLCLYAVLMPKKMFKAFGGFDENIQSGDDVDASRRIRALGYANGIVLNSLVYHAGGVSADITLGKADSELRKKALETFEKKWGDSPEWKNT